MVFFSNSSTAESNVIPRNSNLFFLPKRCNERKRELVRIPFSQ
jgi:hypothetical protein